MGHYRCGNGITIYAALGGIMLTATGNELSLLRWHGFAALHRGGTASGLIWLILELAVAGVLVWALIRRKSNAA
jgi:hypothetical protein